MGQECQTVGMNVFSIIILVKLTGVCQRFSPLQGDSATPVFAPWTQP